jgi:hypothetical protein
VISISGHQEIINRPLFLAPGHSHAHLTLGVIAFLVDGSLLDAEQDIWVQRIAPAAPHLVAWCKSFDTQINICAKDPLDQQRSFPQTTQVPCQREHFWCESELPRRGTEKRKDGTNDEKFVHANRTTITPRPEQQRQGQPLCTIDKTIQVSSDEGQ